MTVRIVTDSACDVPQEVCDELGIEIVPLSIRFGDREFQDRVELTAEVFWQELAKASVLPETAAPSVGAFEEVFRRLYEDGASGIVCINLSEKMSATMQSARVASKSLDGLCPIEVVDSMSASMGIGMQVMHAAELARDGADVPTIVAAIEDVRNRTKVLFTVDTLEYLKKGGRIGGAQALLGSALSIKPVLHTENGQVGTLRKVRTRSKALQFIIDEAKAADVERICVLHTMPTDLDEFVAMIEPIAPAGKFVIAQVGPVVGVHTGPGVAGIAWIARASS